MIARSYSSLDLKSSQPANLSQLPLLRFLVIRPVRFVLALSLALFCVAWNAPTARAQGVTFAGTQTTLPFGGLTFPLGVAVDSAGDVFVTQPTLSSVIELPRTPTGYGTRTKLPFSGLFNPLGIVVDSAGDLIVADQGNDRVVKLLRTTTGYGAQTTLPFSDLATPIGVAIDGAGDLFVVDNGNNDVVELPWTGTGYGSQTTLPFTGVYQPYGVAVDGAGDVFVVTFYYYDGILAELPRTATGYGTQINLLGGLYQSYGVAVDSAGDVFADDSSGVLELPRTATGYGAPTVVGTGLSGVLLAVDSSGNLFVPDNQGGIVTEVQLHSVDFGSANVCPAGQTTPTPCSNTLTLNYNVAADTTIGSIKVLTQGAPSLDFHPQAKDTSTTLCSAQTYSSATTCSVDVTFAPLYPGARNGEVEILDGSGNILAATNIHGTGTGPEIAFTPAKQAAIGSGFSVPGGVAVAAVGDVFVADSGTSAVYQVLAAGGYSTVRPLGGTFTFTAPGDVALDGSANVFVTDSGTAKVYEILANGGYTTVDTLASTFAFGGPSGVALDGTGNVFVADYLNKAVYEILAAGGYTIVNTLGGGYSFGSPAGVALDTSDNVYIADTLNGQIYEITAASSYETVTPVASYGFADPLGVAVDDAGNIYLTQGPFNFVEEILKATGQAISLGGSFGRPYGLALDGGGNLYISDPGKGITSPSVQVIQRSQPPLLSFAATNVGSTSSDSPQSVVLQNIGNATLTGSGTLNDSTDFTVLEGPGIVPDCNPETLPLAPGAACSISFDFTPQSVGQLSGTLTLSDNSLNGNPATQTISLSGTGIGPIAQVSTTLLQFGTVAFPGTETLSLTIKNIGKGSLAVVPSINGPSYTITGNSCAGGVTAGDSCTLHIQFNPVTVGDHDDILTLTTNGPTNPSVALKGLAGGVGATLQGALQFGTIPYGTTEVLPLTIYNYGVTGTVFVGTSINGPSYKILTTSQNTCLAGIRAGQTCTLPVEFDPVAVGLHDDILTLTPTGGAAATTVSLKGRAD